MSLAKCTCGLEDRPGIHTPGCLDYGMDIATLEAKVLALEEEKRQQWVNAGFFKSCARSGEYPEDGAEPYPPELLGEKDNHVCRTFVISDGPAYCPDCGAPREKKHGKS